MACLILKCLNFNSHVSTPKEKKKHHVNILYILPILRFLYFILFFYVFHFFFFFFMVTKQIFIFIFSIFFFTFLYFLGNQTVYLAIVCHSLNPPDKDSQSQISHGLIYILHMAAPRQGSANTNAAPPHFIHWLHRE